VAIGPRRFLSSHTSICPTDFKEQEPPKEVLIGHPEQFIEHDTQILGFVKKQVANKSPRTRKKAKEFLKKWEKPE
jgi:hypothetical protein